jgi:hypothetical protein
MVGCAKKDRRHMTPQNERALECRVTKAAEEALAHQQYVSPIDVLVRMGLLAPAHLSDWRKGRVDFLERVIQGNLNKISKSMDLFRRWAVAKGLRPSETGYVHKTRAGTRDLRFSASGDPSIEAAYRTHYVSPALSERKRQNLESKLSSPGDTVVFQILRDSKCSECGEELGKDCCLVMEADKPLCLKCAGLDDLEYLEAGDQALTRRASKYSERRAVVVRFSRSRNRYERQGLLLEPAAIDRAGRELGARPPGTIDSSRA